MSLGFTQVTIALILKGVLNSRYKKHAGWLETRSAPTLGASSSDQPTAAPPLWHHAAGGQLEGRGSLENRSRERLAGSAAVSMTKLTAAHKKREQKRKKIWWAVIRKVCRKPEIHGLWEDAVSHRKLWWELFWISLTRQQQSGKFP